MPQFLGVNVGRLSIYGFCPGVESYSFDGMKCSGIEAYDGNDFRNIKAYVEMLFYGTADGRKLLKMNMTVTSYIPADKKITL